MADERATILLVDDRDENLLALEAILEALGHRLLRASSGEQALRHLLSTEVSLILLDVQMPEMDGYETAAHIKSRQRTEDIPIIFLTAIDREAHLAYRGYAAGAVDFLAKPFDPWVLRAKAEVFLRLHQERRALTAQIAALTRRLEAAGTDRLQQVLQRVERLLVMAGDGSEASGPALQALAEVQALRADLAGPRS